MADVTLPLGETENDAEERVLTASQWQLMWWRFRKHRLGIVSVVILFTFYVMALFAGFFAPHDPYRIEASVELAPPTPLRWSDENGPRLFPFVYGYTSSRDLVTLQKTYEVDESQKYNVRLFVRGASYKIVGLIESDIHLFGLDDPDAMILLLGADDLGRDVLSRTIYGAQISLSIGLVGGRAEFISWCIIFGGISGYYGGWIDTIIQRVIEFLKSLPVIPLWLTLSAAVPRDWGVVKTYFAIVTILSLIGWADLARGGAREVFSTARGGFHSGIQADWCK